VQKAAFGTLGRALLLALAAVLTAVTLGPSPLLAQATPPEIGAVVVEDPLTTPSVRPVGQTPTVATLGENVGEGISTMRGLIIADGEVAVDFWVTQGAPRTTIGINARVHDRDAIGITFAPGEVAASVFKRTGGQLARVATRRDLAGYVDLAEWNRLAVRVRGNEVWLLLNDEPLLYTDAAANDQGLVQLYVIREGSLDDNVESSVVFRNLAMSTLADGE
jgi:hypothetical protein